jgi:predicted dehydrogenase
LCQSIHEARAMVNWVRARERVFQTGSMQRSMREFRVAVELIRNGVIGKVEKVDAGVGGGPGVPCDLPGQPHEPGLDWNLWLGPAPWRPYNSILSPRGVHDNFPDWRKYREYGGGMVTDWGAHHFDIVQWALDMDDSGPVEIFPASEPNAQSGVRFVYANGTEVTHVTPNGITFFGSAGKLYVNRGKFELTIGDVKKAESTKDLDGVVNEYLSGDVKRVYTSNDHKADWLECVRTRKRPCTDVEVGARSVTVCHLVNLAYYHGRRLKWDAKRELFADGTGDMKWLDVPYRDPWRLVPSPAKMNI